MKLRDYFEHTSRLRGFRPEIYFTPSSSWDAVNPWTPDRDRLTNSGQLRREWDATDADILFVEGMDWLSIPEDNKLPVINLVQGIRHANPSDPRYKFLQRPAIRICVSDEVAEALRATNRVNGPIYSIPASLDWKFFPPVPTSKDISLIIVGLKQPQLAEELSARLSACGIKHICLTRQLPRSDFLEILARSHTAVLLPLLQEGFYLPALEAMALDTLVVCPDCAGNRSFCLDRITCFRPPYTLEEILSSVIHASRLSSDRLHVLLAAARRRTAAYGIEQERESYHRILKTI